MIEIIQTNPDSISNMWYEKYQYFFIINKKLRLQNGIYVECNILYEEFKIMEVT
jgi:hypothetical protein